MDNVRVMNEVLALQDTYPVEYSLDEGLVTVKQIQFPTGWQPRSGHILYELSEVYPRTPPWVYIPSRHTYQDGGTPHRLTCDKPGYHKWCLERLDWNPSRHTLVTMTKLLLASMEQPSSSNPFKQV